MKKDVLVSKVLPGLIFFSLWLDGWFFPLVLLPFLYVLLVEKKDFQWLGFRKQGFKSSIFLGLLALVVLIALYYPIFLYYSSLIKRTLPSLYDIFTDVFWYPLYEEVAYRCFFLVHFAVSDGPKLSKRNLTINFLQSFLFLFIHKRHVTSGMSLVLVPVFLLALLNGFLFLRTRNIFGCIISHCTINSFGWLLHVYL